MTDPQLVPQQRLWNAKLPNFWEFHKRGWTPRQERIHTHGNEMHRELLAPHTTLIHKLSTTSMVRSSCTPAHWLNMRNWKKFLIYSNNWKHQHYQLSSHTKSKTQQLLAGKLTLSQPKPGQSAKTVFGKVRGNRLPRRIFWQKYFPPLVMNRKIHWKQKETEDTTKNSRKLYWVYIIY